MTDPLNRLLDQATVPPLPADFADRVVARAAAESQPPAVPRPRRDRRGAWLRRPGALAAFVGANLLVASAVAATIAGGGLLQLRRVPVLAPVLAAIAPEPKPAPVQRKPVRQAAPVLAEAKAAPVAPVTPAPPLPPRVERRLERGDRLEQAVAEREAAGLPVPPRVQKRVALHRLERQAAEQWQHGEPVATALKTDIVKQRIELAPPAVQARIAERVEARREAGLPVPPALDAAVPAAVDTDRLAPADLADRPAALWRSLSPAERQQVIERIRARRAMRQLRR